MSFHISLRGFIFSLVIITIATALLAGCATGSGTLAATVVETERDDAEKTDDQENEDAEAERDADEGVPIGSSDSDDNDDDGGKEDGENGDDLVISTTPVDALVYIDGRYLGRAPLRIETVEPGRYTIRVAAEGYVGVTQSIRIEEGSQVDITIRLEPITGRLHLTGDVDGATVRLDGSAAASVAVERRGMDYELPIGRYRVVVERFGYEPFRRTIEVEENRTTGVQVNLEPLDFAVRSVDINRRRFSPNNGGALGRTRVSFTVTTPGRGTFQVTDADGSLVYEKQLGPFRGPKQRVSWDGTISGTVAPDGRYELRIQGVGDGFDGADQVTRELVVDSSLVLRFRGTMSGVSGLSYSPLPDTLPADAWQLSATAIGHRAAVDGSVALRMPSWAAVRVGLSGDAELAVQAGATFVSETPARWFAATSVKKGLFTLGDKTPFFASAIAGRAAIRSTGGRATLDGPDTLTNFPGLALSAPVTLGRRFRLSVTPEIIASPARVYYGTEKEALQELFGPNPGRSDGWGAWMYARMGAMYETPEWGVGVSAALRSTPLGEGVGIDLPLQAAAEGHVIIPGTSMFVKGILTTEAIALDNFYVVGGGSVGFLF